jgi:hypothetical protein
MSAKEKLNLKEKVKERNTFWNWFFFILNLYEDVLCAIESFNDNLYVSKRKKTLNIYLSKIVWGSLNVNQIWTLDDQDWYVYMF